MNCANHVDVPATAFCRTCGKPLCSSCARDVRGVIYCEECLASHLSGTMPPPGSTAVPPGVEPPTGLPRPGLAAILGFIPGRGRHVQRGVCQRLCSRADFRHSDLDDRSHQRYLRPRHRRVHRLYADRGLSDGASPRNGLAGARSLRLQQSVLRGIRNSPARCRLAPAAIPTLRQIIPPLPPAM